MRKSVPPPRFEEQERRRTVVEDFFDLAKRSTSITSNDPKHPSAIERHISRTVDKPPEEPRHIRAWEGARKKMDPELLKQILLILARHGITRDIKGKSEETLDVDQGAPSRPRTGRAQVVSDDDEEQEKGEDVDDDVDREETQKLAELEKKNRKHHQTHYEMLKFEREPLVMAKRRSVLISLVNELDTDLYLRSDERFSGGSRDKNADYKRELEVQKEERKSKKLSAVPISEEIQRKVKILSRKIDYHLEALRAEEEAFFPEDKSVATIPDDLIVDHEIEEKGEESVKTPSSESAASIKSKSSSRLTLQQKSSHSSESGPEPDHPGSRFRKNAISAVTVIDVKMGEKPSHITGRAQYGEPKKKSVRGPGWESRRMVRRLSSLTNLHEGRRVSLPLEDIKDVLEMRQQRSKELAKHRAIGGIGEAEAHHKRFGNTKALAIDTVQWNLGLSSADGIETVRITRPRKKSIRMTPAQFKPFAENRGNLKEPSPISYRKRSLISGLSRTQRSPAKGPTWESRESEVSNISKLQRASSRRRSSLKLPISTAISLRRRSSQAKKMFSQEMRIITEINRKSIK